MSAASAQRVAPVSNDVESGAYLQRELDTLERSAFRWYWGWMGVLSGLVVGQGMLAALENGDTRGSRGKRAGYLTGVGMSTAALVFVAARPMPSRHAGRRFRAGGSRLAQGEAILRESEAAANRTRGWLTHAIAAAAGLGVGLGLGLGYDDPWLGARSGIATTFMTELRAWTYPYRPKRSRAAYQSDEGLSLQLSPLGLRGRF